MYPGHPFNTYPPDTIGFGASHLHPYESYPADGVGFGMHPYTTNPFSYPPDGVGCGYGLDQIASTPAAHAVMNPPSQASDGVGPPIPGIPAGPCPCIPGMHHGMHHISLFL